MSTGCAAGSVEVDGSTVRWWSSGSGDRPVVLVHGGGAHAGWWHDVAQVLAPRHQVITLDLSGHGDSGTRSSYTVAGWADEIAAVIRATAPGGAVLVAHSMGGRPATLCAARHREAVTALVLVDSVIPTEPDERVPSVRPRSRYATREEALARFRLSPPSDLAPAATVRRLAERGVRREETGGWTWKFDPAVFTMPDAALVDRALPDISCPVSVVRGSASDVTSAGQAGALEALLGQRVERVEVPGAGHHLMVESPDAVAELLDQLLEGQRASANS